jgi:hypothetical protein
MRAPALLLLLLAACSTESTGPDAGAVPAPVLRFTYAGPESGSFVAEGAPVPGAPQLQQTFAQGRRSLGTHRDFEILAVARRGASAADLVTIGGLPQAVGTHVVDARACDGSGPSCPRVLVGLDLPTDGRAAQARASCSLETGTVRITTWSSTRAVGVLSGTGRCTMIDGRVVDGFRITDGRFDVALTDVRS